jgi:hypothetical protein
MAYYDVVYRSVKPYGYETLKMQWFRPIFHRHISTESQIGLIGHNEEKR